MLQAVQEKSIFKESHQYNNALSWHIKAERSQDLMTNIYIC